MKYIKHFILAILLLVSTLLIAQKVANLPELKKKQILKIAKSYEKADDYYNACKYYEMYLAKDSSKAIVYYRLAEQYRKARDYSKASKNYKIAYTKKPDKLTNALFYDAEMLKSQELIELQRIFSENIKLREEAPQATFVVILLILGGTLSKIWAVEPLKSMV